MRLSHPARDYPSIVHSHRHGGLRAVCGEFRFGFATYATLSLPDRLYLGLDEASRPRSFTQDEPAVDLPPLSTPLDVLLGSAWESFQAWPTETRRTVARLEALWLLTEDRYRRLDADKVDPLAHQVALVEHILSTPGLERVLIADEVGLGKTIEAGRIIERLQAARPAFRVLYLTEARLVENVMEEFARLDLRPMPRRWTTDHPEARLMPGESDPFVVASIHRAVVNSNVVGKSGPWDMILVDEAHHITDWSEEGDSPQERMKLVRQLIRDRLVPGGRLILLSGTPHQGHGDRFRNLLRLLSEREDEGDARGRVIYRIKDDIGDWNGDPLFPIRQVNEPRSIVVSEHYHGWMAAVHTLLSPGPGGSRAAGWRRSQALQWCASSPQAGLAYLVRLALRSGITAAHSPPLVKAIAALRPFRGGPANEGLEALEERLRRAGGQIGEEVDVVFGGGRAPLEDVLQMGIRLITDDAFGQKLDALFDLLDLAPEEKFVVFAQPIETVYTLRERLEKELGPGTVAMIVGGQDDAVRDRQIQSFLNSRAVRVLVSSRSGGEGINLQVARRLVHFDIPWNPMELEQRVGRVHRYGGSQTVVVDTLVLGGSREERVLSRARMRLLRIVQDLDRSRQETLFSRTMSLIPLDELAAMMAGEDFGSWGVDENQRIDALVMEGFKRYQESELEFREHAVQLAAPEPGAATHSDLESWLIRATGAHPASGWRRWILTNDPGAREPVRHELPARLLELPTGHIVGVHPDTAVGLIAPDGLAARPVRIGLNDPWVLEQLRAAVDSEKPPSGAGLLLVLAEHWRSWFTGAGLPKSFEGGAFVLCYLIRRVSISDFREVETEMRWWMCSEEGADTSEVSSKDAGALLRLLREPRLKVRPPESMPVEALRSMHSVALAEVYAAEETAGALATGVFPLAALLIEPTTERVIAPGISADHL
jgi:superfamily II DNA or RNA helicase